MALKIKHVDYKRGVALVQSKRNIFPVQLQKWLKFLVVVGDLAIVKKSPVSGEWIMTDYIRIDGDVDYEN